MKKEFINPDELDKPAGFTRAIKVRKADTFIFVSGTAPLDEKSQLVGVGDFAVQARKAFENIKTILKGCGATWKDVVKTTYYLADISSLKELRQIRTEYIDNEKPPASTAVEVKLTPSTCLIEIDAIALI
jgi:reactive intermediate/imine deaminase